MKKKILVLGCTGSIGESTIAILKEFPHLFELAGLSANKNKQKLLETAACFGCKNVCLASGSREDSVPYAGKEDLIRFIQETEADIVVNGIAGSAGLLPSAAALTSGKNLALANKETIVMAGSLIKKMAQDNNCSILPVDSEHSAIFNLLQKFKIESIESLVITASGGPFRTMSSDKLSSVAAEDALKHPTWNMGKKITIDSATLANKGLEVIEASILFDMPPEKIQVAVHPQSIVHSLIRTKDGVLYAQLSKPDMRHPILSALTWPHFVENSFEKLDLFSGSSAQDFTLTFSLPRFKDFPMLDLAYTALRSGGSYAIAYNAANEIAADAFLHHQISFTKIAEITEQILNKDWTRQAHCLEEVFSIDAEARSAAAQELQ
ncbi:MAG: 1-deoxy-D-xylulose-5-phosphate reductoisomerase [Bacteroides sp.]|nr:1-deoxy-D-xylulose-5-phosphate reductoisomerase [Prevotella sp.]MCM1408221.1 1-deoxy-D-xylulose-5-phosphate reductoisomerase [Treponema brennaborense]MCM1469545.1 1-deoxy-D-xylulose-5-phosphate reductoisomerase [Bacteroides sp.]